MGFHHDALTQLSTPMHFSSELGTSESVIIHRLDRSDEATEAIVALTQQYTEQETGRQTVIRGDVVFPIADKAKLSSLAGITAQGKRLEILVVGLPVDGNIKVSVTRTDYETTTASTALDPL